MIVTFYSHKGGVGRTLALANVAYSLATDRYEPCKVLIWDFDLEAPGLQQVFKCNWGKKKLGFVDLISRYLDTGEIADISEYVHPTDVQGVDILPAGYMDESYPSKYGKINWGDLYHNKDGFDLLENIKLQIQSREQKYDYVLIDSRTGYSDVSGICTLQLPQVVVLVFRLNDQNLTGISDVYKIIQSHCQEKGTPSIDVIPVISPTLPFAAKEANTQYRKARHVFGELELLNISFDPALNYKERIMLKERAEYKMIPPILRDYSRLSKMVRRLNQEDPLTVFEAGLDRHEVNDFDGAFQKFKRAIELRPQNPRYWTHLVEAADPRFEVDQESLKIKQVEALVNQYLDQHPSDAQMFLVKAKVLSIQGQPLSDEILSVLNKAIEIDPNLIEAYMLRGRFKTSLRQYEQAIADLSKRVELDTKDWDGFSNRAYCYQQLHDFTKAESDYGRAIQLNRKEPFLYFRRAKFYFSCEMFDKANADIQKILAIAPSFKQSHLLLIHLLMRMGQREEALRRLDALVSEGLQHSDYLNFAEAYICTAQPNKALKLIDEDLPEGHPFRAVTKALKTIVELLLGKVTSKKVRLETFKPIKSSWDWTELEVFAKRAGTEGLFPEEVMKTVLKIVQACRH